MGESIQNKMGKKIKNFQAEYFAENFIKIGKEIRILMEFEICRICCHGSRHFLCVSDVITV